MFAALSKATRQRDRAGRDENAIRFPNIEFPHFSWARPVSRQMSYRNREVPQQKAPQHGTAYTAAVRSPVGVARKVPSAVNKFTRSALKASYISL